MKAISRKSSSKGLKEDALLVYDDASISPVIRQTLQHWAYELTARDVEDAIKKMGGA